MYKKKDNYIDFLDSFHQKETVDYFDMVQVLNAAQVHYHENNYQFIYPTFNQYSPNNLRSSNLICEQESGVKYGAFGSNNEARRPELFDLHKIPNIPLFIPPSCTSTRKKEEIIFPINSIGDIIDMLDKHPYNPEVEYNIDLKNLHHIRPELVLLNNMIGLTTLKNEILNQLVYFLQEPILSEKNKGYKHTILCGPPGTGKTEIAQIIGKMYSKLGVLKNNTTTEKDFIFKKATRGDLIAGFLGQTALKTKDVIQECLGGCLFIDEAYSLGNAGNNDSFSRECIDTLCEALSNHKDDLMVIIAGYETELNNHFFSVNPGLESRFIWKFTIDKYSPSEMCQIFNKKMKESEWTCDVDNNEQTNWFEKHNDHFKYYGRDIEQLLLYTKIVHARRIYGKPRDLCKKITIEDMNNAFKTFQEHQNSTNKMSESLYGLYT